MSLSISKGILKGPNQEFFIWENEDWEMDNVSHPLARRRKTEKRKLSEGSAICSCFELGKKITRPVVMQSFRGSIHLEFSFIDFE